MAQGYKRKDNRPKMCFKGDWTKDHHMEDFAPDFCPSVFFAIFSAPFSDGIHSLPFSFFLLLLLFLLACAFLVFAHFCFQQDELSTFLLSIGT